MDIHFLKREMKRDKIEISPITIPYLMVIQTNHPNLWAGFKRLIAIVEEENKKRR